MIDKNTFHRRVKNAAGKLKEKHPEGPRGVKVNDVHLCLWAVGLSPSSSSLVPCIFAVSDAAYYPRTRKAADSFSAAFGALEAEQQAA